MLYSWMGSRFCFTVVGSRLLTSPAPSCDMSCSNSQVSVFCSTLSAYATSTADWKGDDYDSAKVFLSSFFPLHHSASQSSVAVRRLPIIMNGRDQTNEN